MSRTLLRNGLVVPIVGRPAWRDIVVEAGRIVEISENVPAQGFTGQVVDCSGRIIMPGLVNGHLHPELHVLKGVVEERDLHEWEDAEHYAAAIAVLSSPEGSAIQRAAMRASLADCLLTGTTCVATYGVTNGADDVVPAILRELGMRGQITIRDVAFEPVQRELPCLYRLHAEEALTVDELSAAAAAHNRGERLVMHAAETEYRLRLIRETFGTSTVRLLERYGLLSPRMLLSHAVYVDEAEQDLLAARGVAVVSSPSAEMKLADGLAPIVELMQKGVTVALGTDCAICNNSDDMFLEMRQLGLAQKLRYGAHAISAEQILLAATLHGARALGLEDSIGALTEGRAADLVVVDAENARLQPLIVHERYDNVAANLVYAATGQDVVSVMVDGEWLVRNRRLLTADAAAIWRELRAAANELYERILK